jgi:hypothetical protein
VDRDRLLQPSLADREALDARERPWRLSSQIYVAFFGGALAIGAIALINAWRLRLPGRTQAVIAASAAAAELALVVVAHLVDIGDGARIASGVAGLLAYGPAYLLQRSADRVYHYHSDDPEPYDGLLGPGFVACLAARIAEFMLWQVQ